MSHDGKDDEKIYKVDTVPPPAGEDDAYNAPTKVGQLEGHVLEALKAKGLGDLAQYLPPADGSAGKATPPQQPAAAPVSAKPPLPSGARPPPVPPRPNPSGHAPVQTPMATPAPFAPTGVPANATPMQPQGFPPQGAPSSHGSSYPPPSTSQPPPMMSPTPPGWMTPSMRPPQNDMKVVAFIAAGVLLGFVLLAGLVVFLLVRK